jgi:hypothetical protein
MDREYRERHGVYPHFFIEGLVQPEFRSCVGNTVKFDHNGSKVDIDELTESKKIRQITQISQIKERRGITRAAPALTDNHSDQK